MNKVRRLINVAAHFFRKEDVTRKCIDEINHVRPLRIFDLIAVAYLSINS